MDLLRRHYLPTADITHIESCVQADQFQPPYDLILLDHDLGGRQMDEHEDCGTTFVDLVKDRVPREAVVVIHSFNEAGAWRMATGLRQHGVRNIIVAPFASGAFKRVLYSARGEAA